MSTTHILENNDFEEQMLNEAEKFLLETDKTGETVYRWVDTSIDHLPTHKLEDIVRLSELPECDIDPFFLDSVIVELLSRRGAHVC